VYVSNYTLFKTAAAKHPDQWATSINVPARCRTAGSTFCRLHPICGSEWTHSSVWRS